MDKTAALAQLKDIHLPPAISWWPPAPGWIGLCILFILALGYGFYVSYRRSLQNRPRRQALALLQHYAKAYEKDQNAALASANITGLLKRVALVYFPRKEVAGLQGLAWIDFLNQSSKGLDFTALQYLLLELPFKKVEAVDLKPLFQCSSQWIKQRRCPCSN